MSVYEESLSALRATGGLEKFMTDFRSLPDNLSRVQAIQSQEWLPNFMVTASRQEKSNIKAHKLADQAAKQVKVSKLPEALDLANRAVQLAAHPKADSDGFPQGFDVLCRAYAVRAKILFDMHHFHSSALDAQRSLSYTLHPYAPTQVKLHLLGCLDKWTGL